MRNIFNFNKPAAPKVNESPQPLTTDALKGLNFQQIVELGEKNPEGLQALLIELRTEDLRKSEEELWDMTRTKIKKDMHELAPEEVSKMIASDSENHDIGKFKFVRQGNRIVWISAIYNHVDTAVVAGMETVDDAGSMDIDEQGNITFGYGSSSLHVLNIFNPERPASQTLIKEALPEPEFHIKFY